MHLIIPFAASHTLTGPEVWAGLQLPNLQALLTLLQRQQVLQDPEATPLHLPHERLQAQALGWAPDAPTLPWAAWHQAQQGLPSTEPQAWMTPCHWQIGMDQVVMADPAHLHLSDEESQHLLQAMQPFLQEDGLQVTWHSALRWHAQGPLLAELSTASLDRVIDQNVKDWMPVGSAARPLQRLQSEMQMLLYNHPVNDARDARRQHTVNAFWLHGAGTLPEGTTVPAQPATVSTALRSGALHGNAQAWRQAWQQLDTSAVADLLQHVKATGQGTLSLCSEHTAHTYTAAPAAWHQRLFKQLFNKTTPAAALQALITT
ncbi:hypothetical protein [Limnohabitans sp. Jir72]|uniref:hypothetical protein n=1 Tax=Limnohabitans sp. Jir72 TaxID=1977909 RepID=UPI000D3AC836|nr:hypothetical protein [Limnohabitans sp. Jir72]PUE33819.1 hypothetical protein B9Z52_06845 [Limnohabitans sp. Jir72]